MRKNGGCCGDNGPVWESGQESGEAGGKGRGT